MEQVKEALDGGITFLQLREKELGEKEFLREAKDMKALAAAYHVPFIINDNVELALAIGADGVHVGQDDMEAGKVREKLGPDKIIGVSAHSVEEAVQRKMEQIIWERGLSFPLLPREMRERFPWKL